MTEPISNSIANEILHDIEVVYGREKPVSTRSIFQYLQPHYDRARIDDLVERLVSAYHQLESENKRNTFQHAVIEALQRCATTWLGSTRTLTTASLAYCIARDMIPSYLWGNLLGRRAPNNEKQTADFLEQLITMLKTRGIQVDVQGIGWEAVIKRIEPRALPTAAEWMLSLPQTDENLARDIYAQVNARLRNERHNLEKFFPHWDELENRLRNALPPKLRNSKILPGKSLESLFLKMVEVDLQGQKDYLIRYVSTSNDKSEDKDKKKEQEYESQEKIVDLSRSESYAEY